MEHANVWIEKLAKWPSHPRASSLKLPQFYQTKCSTHQIDWIVACSRLIKNHPPVWPIISVRSSLLKLRAESKKSGTNMNPTAKLPTLYTLTVYSDFVNFNFFDNKSLHSEQKLFYLHILVRIDLYRELIKFKIIGLYLYTYKVGLLIDCFEHTLMVSPVSKIHLLTGCQSLHLFSVTLTFEDLRGSVSGKTSIVRFLRLF